MKGGYDILVPSCTRKDGKICTNCAFGNGTNPTTCVCENPPFSVPAKCPPAMSYTLLFSIMIYHRYNEECGMGKECAQATRISDSNSNSTPIGN